VLGRGLVGRRVTVRSRLPPREDRLQFTDVVGVLVAADEHGLVVRRMSGEEVRVAAADVHRLHPVRPSTADILALEEVAALGWPAPHAEWLGRWLLRAADGWTGRANSVLPLGDPGLDLDTALAQVTGWYAGHGLPPRFQVPLPARAALDAALADRGWTAYNPTWMLTADVDAVLAAAGPAAPALPVPPPVTPPVTLAVTLAASPSADWLAAYHYRGGDRLPAVAAGVMTAADRPVFATVRDGDTVVAIARAVLDAGWAGVTALEVAPEHRRRGLALRVMRALCEWARDQSASRMYLQVADENAAALGLYRRLDFTVHHRYHYRLGSTPAKP